MTRFKELSPDQLASRIDPSTFDFKSTKDVESLENVIGQERAVKALEFGLNIKNKSYNIFVTGQSGTGKTTIVRDILNQRAQDEPIPNDWLMVNNFTDPYRPMSFPLPPGKGAKFSRKMDQLIENLKKEMPRAFETEDYQKKRSKLMEGFQEKKREKINDLEEKAGEHDIQIQTTNAGFQTVPIIDGKPIDQEMYNNLEEKERQKVDANVDFVQREMQSTLREINKLEKEFQDKVHDLNKEVTLFVVGHRIDSLKEEFTDHGEVEDYLEHVKEDIIENVQDFLQTSQGNDNQQVLSMFQQDQGEPDFTKYRVNVLVDHSKTKGAPVIVETNPTYNNIFGRMEKRAHLGAVYSDFTMIQPGSLIRANGGYLVIEVEGVLTNPFVWDNLKRSLRNGEVRSEDVQEQVGYVSVSSLKPEPIPLNVKVILIGRREIFDMLLAYDEQFEKTFKVRADFNYETDKVDESIQEFVKFIAKVCRQENLLHFAPDGVAALIEMSQRSVSDQEKLSLRFGKMVEIITESGYWAKQENKKLVDRDAVERAFSERRYRSSLAEEQIRESVLRDIRKIDTEGAVTGQINALSVYQVGDFSFGQPTRITAEAFMGKDGVINIERNAKLSGKIHNKGMEILSGWLGKQFAQDIPLNLNISLTFEQSYGGVDGDSASSTEAYVILSSLSGLPIKQNFAVTGSMNQKGEVQAIGGVNQKIEGYFDICKHRGLTGDQGVLIPVSNVKHLMLKPEVIQAVKDGQFHIYPIEYIREGIEILTGVAAGDPDDNGKYPADSIFGKVKSRLTDIVRQSYQLKDQFSTKGKSSSGNGDEE